MTVVQRTSSDLKLNPHLHGVFLDGSSFWTPGASPPSVLSLDSPRRMKADVLVEVSVRLLSMIRKLRDAWGIPTDVLSSRIAANST